MKKRLKFLIGLSEFFLFGVIVLTFSLLKLDDYFDGIDGALLSKGHLVIVSFRLLIYLLPAFIMWVVFLFVKRHKFTILDAYRYQFITYSIIGLIWVLSGLDYITSTDVFGAMDSFTIMIGLLLSLIFKKSVQIESDLPPIYKK